MFSTRSPLREKTTWEHCLDQAHLPTTCQRLLSWVSLFWYKYLLKMNWTGWRNREGIVVGLCPTGSVFPFPLWQEHMHSSNLKKKENIKWELSLTSASVRGAVFDQVQQGSKRSPWDRGHLPAQGLGTLLLSHLTALHVVCFRVTGQPGMKTDHQLQNPSRLVIFASWQHQRARKKPCRMLLMFLLKSIRGTSS